MNDKLLSDLRATRDTQRIDLCLAMMNRPLDAGGLWWATINQRSAAVATGYRNNPDGIGPQGKTWRKHAIEHLKSHNDEFCGGEQFGSYDSFQTEGIASLLITAEERNDVEIIVLCRSFFVKFVGLGDLLGGPGGVARGPGCRSGGVVGDHQRTGARGGQDDRRDAIRALAKGSNATVLSNQEWFGVQLAQLAAEKGYLDDLAKPTLLNYPNLRSPMVVERCAHGMRARCKKLIRNWGGPVWEVDWDFNNDSVRSVSWYDITPRWKGTPPQGWNLKRQDPPFVLEPRDLGTLIDRISLGSPSRPADPTDDKDDDLGIAKRGNHIEVPIEGKVALIKVTKGPKGEFLRWTR